MERSRMARNVAGGVLSVTGKVLKGSARVVSATARLVLPGDRRRTEPEPEAQREVKPVALAVSQPPTEPVVGIDRARRPDTHAQALAQRPAAEVVKAIAGLSTDELRRLYEEEQAGKRRKTVLRAVERALSPASS